jgi:diketogulonate reductase-like aldo/keto reductase
MVSKQQSLQDTFNSSADGLMAHTKLNNGVCMPWLGFGVWNIEGDALTESVVRTGFAHGYRSIDTAALYANEQGVGRAIERCGVPRDQLFVTTKVWNTDIRQRRIEAAFEESMQRLGLDTLDLYLVHWPIKGEIVSAWKVLEKLQQSGRIKAIGVSNHMIPHLDELLAVAKIVPAVNQIEFHPYLQSPALVDYCRSKGIQVEAWSPLMQGGEVLQDPVIGQIARHHGKTAAQVILRWEVQSGVVAIPRSTKETRLVENAGIFDFSLSAAELAAMAKLDRNQRSGADPFNFAF